MSNKIELDKIDLMILKNEFYIILEYIENGVFSFDTAKKKTRDIISRIKFNESDWIKYGWENRDSHPPRAGRYLIYRAKCDKMHFEQWNGSGWSSSNNDCTHWSKPQKPII